MLTSLPRPARYILVGGTAFLLNLGLFLLLVDLLALDVRIAEVISRGLGGVVTFFGHKHITFTGEQRLPVAMQGLGYLMLNLVNLAISPWVVYGSVALLGNLVVSKIAAEVIMTLESYLLTGLLFRA
ncbi:MAG: GtrA family protein [Myxococcota bacterium]|nr:GtrA family protein [Myxococcota bacterium]